MQFIGIQWGVIRTVLSDDTAKYNECNQNLTEEENQQESEVIKKIKFSDFVENLWNNKKKILSGEYTDWTKEGHPHSYESKICFLINPKHYKIIFDSQNRESLGKSTYKAEEWQDIVNNYFEDNKGRSLEEAIVCWKYKKSLQGHNRYEKSDLVALDDKGAKKCLEN